MILRKEPLKEGELLVPPPILREYIWEGNKVKALFTMIISLSTVWLIGVIVSYVDGRLPPKFLKATNNVGKALYAGRYAYSMVPIPPKIVLQANVARKEIHVPLRTYRRKRRPFHPLEYAHKFQNYSPLRNKQRGRRPLKAGGRLKTRPPYRDPDYYEQEIEKETDDIEYDYDERPSREYSDDEFVAQHSELYAHGYNPGRKRNPFRDEEEHYDPPPTIYPRKPKPSIKSWTGVMRPTSKVYSAALGAPSRPVLPRDEEERYRYEDDEEGDEFDEVTPRPRYRGKKKRKRYNEDDDRSYREESPRHPESPKVKVAALEYEPDDVYHDRSFESSQKRMVRETEERERQQNNVYRKKNPAQEQEESHPEHEDHSNEQRTSRKPSIRSTQRDDREKQKWSSIKEKSEVKDERREPSITWTIVNESELKNSATIEPWQPEQPSPKKQPWPLSVQTWKDSPQPTPEPKAQQPIVVSWNDYDISKWPTVEEHLKTVKWVDPSVHPIDTPPADAPTRYSAKRKRKETKKEGETVAQRVVGGTLKWKPENTDWPVSPYRRESSSNSVSTSSPNWLVETIKSQDLDSKPWDNGDIVYGSRLSSGDHRRKEPDIGFGQGMEVVDDKVAGWQVY